MKHARPLILFLLVCLSASGATAQLSKGAWMIGGSTAGSFHTRTAQEKRNSFSIYPSVGHFIRDNLVLGLGTGFAMGFYDADSTNNWRATSLSLAPFGRYYLGEGERVRFPVEAAIGVTYTRFKLPTESTNRWSLRPRVGAGLAVFLNPYVSLEVMASYNCNIDLDLGLNSDGFLITSAGFNIFLPSNQQPQ